MHKVMVAGIWCAGLVLSGCDPHNSPSNVQAPGDAKTVKTAVLEQAADTLQRMPPLQAITMYLDGFHFYSGNMRAQMEAHHFCSSVNEEVTQCIIFDGNQRDAKIMGVEYIISEHLFMTLPVAEKKLWHSHAYEVASGELIAPGIPQAAELALMQKISTTYGKTWHTWHTDQQKTLPLGVPQLMMGFTADRQLQPELLASRDRRFALSTASRRQARSKIGEHKVAEGADDWQHNPARQLPDITGIDHTAPH